MENDDSEFVDLTQDDPVEIIRHSAQDEKPVDLSQLSSSSEDEDAQAEFVVETTSPERPVQPAPTKSLYKGGNGIQKLLQLERELRNGLLQRQSSNSIASTTGGERREQHGTAAARDRIERGDGATVAPLTTTAAVPLPTARLTKRRRPTSKTTTTTTATSMMTTRTTTQTPSQSAIATDKEEATALKKIKKQFESEKHVLKFIKVILSPEMMGGAVGLAIAQAFQQTACLAEHERISYEVSTIVFPTTSTPSSHPLIRWNRLVPSEENQGEFVETTEPFAMLCLDGSALEDVISDISKLDTVLDDIEGLLSDSRTNQQQPIQQSIKIYVLTHRMEQRITKRQQQDHREAVLRGGRAAFDGEDVRQALSDLIICRPHVELYDVSSVEEASNHVVSITKAVALRNCASQGCSSKSKFIAGKSKKQHGPGTAMNSLLLKDPLPEHALYAVRALTAIPSVTPQVSHALVKTYGSIRGIYEFLEDRGEMETKRKVLEELRTSGGQRVGPVAARKLVDFFLENDPDTTIDS